MVILLILINGLLATLHVEEQWVAKWCSFTRRRFARAIIDAKALRDLFMNILHIFTLRVYSFHIVERNLSPSTLITFYISLKFKRIFFFYWVYLFETMQATMFILLHLQVFPGNTDRNTVVKNYLRAAVKARFVRFYFVNYNNWPVIRVEIFVLN